jgi:crossover junction endodeoxyribonuclease RuvC
MEDQPSVIVIGMDPASYRNCGWAVLEMTAIKKPVLLEKFTQVLQREQDDLGRLRDIYEQLAELIKKHHPGYLCLERSMGGGLAFVRNNLSENVGVAKLCAYDNSVKVIEVSPAHLKKVITGHGRAKKKHIMANVCAEFGLEKAGVEHECDAAAIALSYLIDLGYPYHVHSIAKIAKKPKKPKKATVAEPSV